jgi:hypothetical protein
MSGLCGCHVHCGDDGDINGPGVCKGLSPIPTPPLVQVVLVPRSQAAVSPAEPPNAKKDEAT